MEKPKIRFKSFEKRWESYRLSEYSNYRRGSFPQPYGNKEWYGGDNAMPFVQVVDVLENLRLVADTKQKISTLAQPMSVFVPSDSVIVTLQGSIGRVAITQYDAYVDRTILIFEDYNSQTNKEFWAYTIRNKFEIERQKAPGGTIKTITKEALSDFKVSIPEYTEQSAIGSLFRNLDDLLISYKNNLANYQSLKATKLSKMFPKAGQTVPEIRLDGFEDEWEEKEFSKLVKRVTQSSDSDSLPKVEFEDIISGQGRLNKDISSKFDNRKGIHFKPGYTLYGKLRPYLNNWLLPKFEGVALGDFWVFDPNGNDSNFVYYLVQSNRYQKVANDTSGTKMPRSDWKSVSSTIFAIPQTIAEQQAIGAYFSILDNLIATHQEKISQLETLKKKLLQDMFI
ncbi:restriction endonuclease subunit S [Streptococcus parasanguinis]|uniref:restriction endonuclease subunit S n=1 Tax=Streptococcus parasanguinis TaxID=1318 RepID=UPI00233120DA|nr:restriction endonuclease subunit S [Streptococcus parasanguinis]MDB8616785.1 restriction endonuclease subunit S [Streptococcus parasanguinis]MDB8624026.1 restriction endonuclease subunit S [Streptococcus parasanguinis]